MKVLVYNGSPKGSLSTTIQSINYLQQRNPEVNIEIINLMAVMHGDDNAIKKAINSAKDADAIIWAFPLYHLLVASHVKKFIEKISEFNLETVYENKYATALTTSIHYYDNIAHDYIGGISCDFKMHYVDGLSHHMEDFKSEAKREELQFFFNQFLKSATNKENICNRFRDIQKHNFNYQMSPSKDITTTNKRTVIVTDAKKNTNIHEMVNKYVSSVKGNVEVINLNDVNLKHVCVGCCNCAAENICRFDEKDDYRKTIDKIIQDFDIIIYASEIKDRYFSSKMKQYFDRSFCYTHAPVFEGKQIGYLVSGPISQLAHMHDVMYAYASGKMNSIGFVSDEALSSNTIDVQIESLAKRACTYAEANYIRTSHFSSVAGQKIFTDAVRDDIPVFLVDYKYYKDNGYYKNISIKKRMSNMAMRTMLKLKPFKKNVNDNMQKYMVEGHKKILQAGIK